ncbi:hypothetical protein HFN20_03695 [Paenibacillus dendritiformis]|uniref:hypothetical protein n=1 Tax=Paenibacillus dendritiformis TaxID=130049 RepID=UPI00143D5AFF|nr:hypothetical protein [Paenibacillus dendritiformis]NKI20346.1 hypothetical protein [Paenibacillus dendritiformis]NRF97993.1 hypothetical protein [Paenibacillus dendritiformis]
MAKREQVVAEAVEETVRSIAQAETDYEQIMVEIQNYCQQAKDLREQAAMLIQSGRTDSQAGAEIRQLITQAERLEMLANRKDEYSRPEALQCIDDLQREASALRKSVQRNQTILTRQQKELEEAREEAVTMVQRAEERVQETERLLAYEMAKLAELEG